MRGGSSWASVFSSKLPVDFSVTSDSTGALVVVGRGARLEVRPLADTYQFLTPLTGDIMELVCAESRQALKVARFLAKAVDAKHVVNVSRTPTLVMMDKMRPLDARHLVDGVWNNVRVLKM